MANVRNLKKDINFVLGDIIENVYMWESTNGGRTDESEAIIDDAIETFDQLITKVNTKKVKDNKSHFKSIEKDLEEKARKLVDRINKLS